MESLERIADVLTKESTKTKSEPVKAQKNPSYKYLPVSTWVDTYKDRLNRLGISRFIFKTEGIDNNSNVLMVSKNSEGTFDVYLLKPKKKHFIPDVYPDDVKFIANDLMIITHDVDNTLAVKIYLTPDLVLINNCIKYTDGSDLLYIPYGSNKIKKGDKKFIVSPPIDINKVLEKLKSKCNMEDLKLIYSKNISSERKKKTDTKFDLWIDAIRVLLQKQSRLDNKLTIRQIDDAVKIIVS